jgi:hypothetical protein
MQKSGINADLNKKFNWPGNIRDTLCRYGFNDIWISQDVVDEDNFLCEFKADLLTFKVLFQKV